MQVVNLQVTWFKESFIQQYFLSKAERLVIVFNINSDTRAAGPDYPLSKLGKCLGPTKIIKEAHESEDLFF